MKRQFGPTNAMYPQPIILISTISKEGKDNIMTAAWTTNAGRDNSSIAISIGGDKLSFRNILQTKDFVINIPGTDLLGQSDFCGQNPGEEIDKFSLTGLTPLESVLIRSKMVKECPINIECRLKETFKVDSANLIIGQAVKVHIDEKILEEGLIDFNRFKPMVYAQKTYFSLGEELGKRGLSQK
jgi:flavin reductase (DIM6/NTAB) family NADH-FMN oxidoreductase RutF